MFSKTLSAFPTPRQVPSYTRLSGNIALGCAAVTLLRNRSGNTQPNIANQQVFKRWVGNLLNSINIHTEIVNLQALAPDGLFVANHQSWVDPLVLLRLANFSFIAKQEVANWPIVGGLTQVLDTIYIDRKNKFSVYRSLPDIEHAMRQGARVLVFPEGTTSNTTCPLTFHSMIFETAIQARKNIQALRIEYCDSEGHHLPDVAFVGDDTVMDSLKRILSVKRIYCRIHVLPALSGLSDRKLAALRTRAQILESALKSHAKQYEKH